MQNQLPKFLFGGFVLLLVCSGQPGQAQLLVASNIQQNPSVTSQVVNRQLREVLTELKSRYKAEIMYELGAVEGLTVGSNAVNPRVTLEENLNTILRPLGLRYKKVNSSSYLVTVEKRIKKLARAESPFHDTDVPVGIASVNFEPKEPQKLLNTSTGKNALAAAEHTVTGVVKGETDEGLPGVSVVVKGTTRGTATDANGNFRLDVQDENATLVFSFVGYVNQEISVGGRTTIDLTLVPDLKSLNEVVVVGYGTQKKSHLTGAVGKVTSEGLNQIPVSRPDQALMGKLAGVQIVTNNAQSGSAPTIQVRGAASITAGTQPLIVVDGYPVPTDLSAIDMNDVESIEVLKDAASAAIYGSRGANGVIIVTTKSGMAGKTQVSFNTSVGVKESIRKIAIPSLNEWIDFVKADNNGVLPPEIIAAQRFNAHTDPNDVVLRNGSFQNYQVNVRGGTQQARFFVSGGVVKDKGVVLSNDYTKYNVRANVEFKLGKNFDMGINLSPSYAVQNEMPQSMHDAIRTVAPWAPLFHDASTVEVTGKPLGSLVHQRDFDPARNPVYKATNLPNLSATGNNNSYATILGTTQYNTELRTINNTFLKWNILDGLSFRTSMGVYTRQLDNYFFQSSTASVDALIQGAALARASTRAVYANTRVLDWLNENILNYKKVIGKHEVDAIAGWTAQSTVINTSSSEAINFATDNIQTLNAGTASVLTTFREKNRLLSALARVNYSYNDIYLLSVGSRWDGSSRFGAANRWGYFPSASLGVRISELPFMVNNRTINELKARISYGATGNNNIGNYRAFANVAPVGAVLGSNEGVVPGFNVTSYANQNLGWERTFSVNAGVDIGLLNDRFRLSIDAYDATTDKLLLYLPISGVTGFDGYWVNRGKVQNRGLELDLTARVITGSNFSWTINAVGATVKNKLLDFGGSQQLISTGDPKRVNYFLARVGEPLVQYYGYVQDEQVSLKGSNYWPIGVAAERIFVKDLDGNGKIDLNDRKILGTPYPKFTWGLTNSFRYKSFDLSMIWQGSHGAKILNIDPNYYEVQFNPTAANAYLAYPAERQAFARLKTETDYHVQDGSYIALRNLNLGYSIPKSFSKKLGMAGMRFYATSSNLIFSMAKSYTSLNPEGVSVDFEANPLKKGWQKGAYPVARTVALGMNIDF